MIPRLYLVLATPLRERANEEHTHTSTTRGTHYVWISEGTMVQEFSLQCLC